MAVRFGRGPKYGNHRDECGHDSGKEHDRHQELLLMQRAGMIRGLQHHAPVYELAPSVVLDGRKKPAVRYTPDYTYYEDDGQHGWHFVVEDVKSPITRKNESYRLRRHLMKSVHHIEVREV